MQNAAGYRPDIDGLRAVAVVAVVAFHAGWITGGFVGVDVFFVISGYLISGIIFRHAKQPGYLAQFYGGRIKRIFPALIVVLLICLVLGWFVLLPNEIVGLGKHVTAGAAFVSNFALLHEAGYFDVSADLKPLLHLWSLGIEEQFYLLWPPLMLAAVRWRMPVSIIIGAVLAISFILNLWLVGSKPIEDLYWPVTRLWELTAGAGIAYLEFRGGRLFPKERAAAIASALGLALIIASFWYTRTQPYPGALALLPVAGAVLVIGAGPHTIINRRVLATSSLVFIGLISYPLYLWHWPLFSFVRIVESGNPQPYFLVIAAVLSIVLAWLTYELIEKPIRFGAWPTLKAKAIALAGAMSAIAAAGAFLLMSDGIPQRLPAYAAVKTSPKGNPWLQATISCKLTGLDRNTTCYRSARQEPSSPVDLIIGDSHAEALSRGLSLVNSPAFGQSDLYIVSPPGCPPFFDIERLEEGVRRKCDVGGAMEQVLGERELGTVMLVGRYAMYATGDGYGVDGGLPSRFIEIRRSDGTPEANYASVLAFGLRRTLDRLASKARRIFVALDVPELGFDPQSCVDSRPVRLTAHVREPCAVSRADVERRQASYRPLFETVLKRFPNVAVIDPMSQLCDGQWCYGRDGSHLLYDNADHVHQFGAAKILAGAPALFAGTDEHREPESGH
jgi:peptidoglycan/LPS O-acetylase OafA/YrhL